MNLKQMQKAIALAKSEVELGDLPTDEFDGFGLKGFKPVECTVEQVAQLIRYQARFVNGAWDEEAISEIVSCRRAFQLEDESTFKKACALLQRCYNDTADEKLGQEIGKFLRKHEPETIHGTR